MSAAGAPVGEADLRCVEEFLYLEAELLDDGRFVEWLELLTADVRYRVYAPTIRAGEDLRVAATVMLFNEDLVSLR